MDYDDKKERELGLLGIDCYYTKRMSSHMLGYHKDKRILSIWINIGRIMQSLGFSESHHLQLKELATLQYLHERRMCNKALYCVLNVLIDVCGKEIIEKRINNMYNNSLMSEEFYNKCQKILRRL